MNLVCKVDTKSFQSALRAYAAYSKKSAPDILNTKMYFIARKAIANTRKADRNKIRRDLEASDVTKVVFTKRGKISKSKKNRSVVFGGTKYNTQENSRLAKIVNSKRVKDGKKTLHGEELLAELRKVFSARMRSIGFIKSGWLKGLHTYAPLAFSKAGLPPVDKDANQAGQQKGGARPAHSGQGKASRADMWNNALQTLNSTLKSLPMQIAVDGLQKAFDDETRSMNDYIRQKRMAAEKQFTDSQRK